VQVVVPVAGQLVVQVPVHSCLPVVPLGQQVHKVALELGGCPQLRALGPEVKHDYLRVGRRVVRNGSKS
jgi:hypothetical protein